MRLDLMIVSEIPLLLHVTILFIAICLYGVLVGLENTVTCVPAYV